jgi:uncharacterized membrane protein YgcG
MTLRRSWALGLLGALLIPAGAASAAASRVEDKGGMFTAKAIEEANRLVARIYAETKPHKDVVVESVIDIPSGMSIDQLAEARMRERTVDGVVIVFAKNAKKLAVSVGPETEKKFGDKIKLKDTIVDHFKKGKFDDGLIAGLQFAHSRLTSVFAPAAAVTPRASGSSSTPSTVTTTGADSGIMLWVWIIVGIIGLWIVVGIIRAIFTPAVYVGGGGGYGPGYMGGGYYPGYGGGWGSAFLGGMFGAGMASWMMGGWGHGYGHTTNNFYGGGTPGAGGGADPAAPASDEGRVGSTTTGDWGDSGGSAPSGSDSASAGGGWGDSGGGGGSDFGGGGGSDFGGGGDSGGGGGGDW